MPRLKDWTQEYPGGPWRAHCGGYLLEAGEAGRSLADLAAAGEDGPSWAVRRAGLGTMGDPTAGQVAGDIADTLEAAQDLAELEVIRLLANDPGVRALLVGMWLDPDELEKHNVQMLSLMESVDALKDRADAAEECSAQYLHEWNAIVAASGSRTHGAAVGHVAAQRVAITAIADALGVPERERPEGVRAAVEKAQAEWRGAREALAETRAAMHNREAECEAHKAFPLRRSAAGEAVLVAMFDLNNPSRAKRVRVAEARAAELETELTTARNTILAAREVHDLRTQERDAVRARLAEMEAECETHKASAATMEKVASEGLHLRYDPDRREGSPRWTVYKPRVGRGDGHTPSEALVAFKHGIGEPP